MRNKYTPFERASSAQNLKQSMPFSVKRAFEERILGQEYDWHAVVTNIPYVLLGLGVIFGTILVLLIVRWIIVQCCIPSGSRNRLIINEKHGSKYVLAPPNHRSWSNWVHLVLEIIIFIAMVFGVWVGVSFMGINFWTSPYATLAASVLVGYLFQPMLMSVGCGIAIWWTKKTIPGHYYNIPGVVEGRCVDCLPTWVLFERKDLETGTTVDVMVNTTDVWSRHVEENYYKDRFEIPRMSISEQEVLEKITRSKARTKNI